MADGLPMCLESESTNRLEPLTINNMEKRPLTAAKESTQSVRDEILTALREQKSGTIAGLASQIGVSAEAVRVQLGFLEKEGFVVREITHGEHAQAGRPASTYHLSELGEKLFPKNYGALAVDLIDGVLAAAGEETLTLVLTAITERNVAKWAPVLSGKTMDEKLELLREIYSQADPYTSTERRGSELFLIENNCPYYHVAQERPALCGVTVSTLRRLLGVEVARVEKFQSGDRRCVFQVHADRPLQNTEPVFIPEAKT